ncbi:TonB-dependent receptor plug domain-containing protein [Opitutus sp. ER46]|uniref:TonB-dependent receptor plug domain-containing protein n=1 Tax=Opitutus sp. ER46 TaxID=2161864 RepID=UPI001304DD59|nr:TonB-dependent receptor plug domain-containing protein [Opitutus sp. ER46]
MIEFPVRGQEVYTWGRRLVAATSAFVLVSATWAAADPGPSGKYDTNGNGRIDPEERAAARMDQDRAASAATRATDESEPIMMSPFEVVEESRGYSATNTMSGTRLNTKLEDLASSISVVTKEQMEDFALLDINDVFNYELGTEGTGNFTDIEVETSGNVNDNAMASPNTANRIRGIGNANLSLGNFETSRRVPVDKIGIDAIEISRGPNSSIFGLGNSSGTVNMVPASGNLGRNRTQVQARIDSDSGYREHIDINRVLIKNKLAIRLSQVFMHTGYDLKPSGMDTERYSVMVKYQPFRRTTLTASMLDYHTYGNRPNTIMPRDGTQDWIAAGRPTWDPVLGRAYIDGAVVYSNTKGKLPSYFTSLYQQTGRGSALMYIDQGDVTYWTAPRGTATGTPVGVAPNWDATVKASQGAYTTVIPSFGAYGATQPLFKGAPSVVDQSVYDWSSVNLAAMNWESSHTQQYLVQLTHIFFETQRQLLALQAGWFREDSKSLTDFAYGKPYGYYLIDVNTRQLDGSANPNLGRPFVSIPDTTVTESPLLNDTYRAQLAYKLDLTKSKGWMRWLGLHQLSGYGEYKHFVTRNYRYKPAMVSDHPWLPGGISRATSTGTSTNYGPEPYNQNSPTGTRNYYMYYVGDVEGGNVDYAPKKLPMGTYGYTYGDAALAAAGRTGVFVTEPVDLGLAATLDGTGNVNNALKIQKTYGAVLQSSLLKNRLITTLGYRHDEIYDKTGVLPKLLPDGKSHDFGWDRQWAADWEANRGNTTTAGAVLKVLPWFHVFANKSDSFMPEDPAYDLHGRRVPNPKGKGEEYGFALYPFGGKLSVRATHYKVRQMGSRRGTSTTIAARALGIDIWDHTTSRDFALQNRAAIWIQNQAGGTLSPDQLSAKVAETMKLDPALISLLSNDEINIAEPEDTLAQGNEVEINFNPNSYWTVRANFAEQESIQAKVGAGLLQYLAERQPVWESIIDADSGLPWFTTQYQGPNYSSPKMYLEGNNVAVPLTIAIAQEGMSMPQVRKYRANLSTSYRLAGISGNKILKNVSVGGAIRWQDKGAIGYYAVPAVPPATQMTMLDRNRPVWSPATTAYDLFLTYRTKLFRNRIGATFQLNVRDLTERGHIEAVKAWPDGSGQVFRIVPPRQFLLTATFDL